MFEIQQNTKVQTGYIHFACVNYITSRWNAYVAWLYGTIRLTIHPLHLAKSDRLIMYGSYIG